MATAKWTSEGFKDYQERCLESFKDVTWPHTDEAFVPSNMAQWGLHKHRLESHQSDHGDLDDCVKCHFCALISFNWEPCEDRPAVGHFKQCLYRAWYCGRLVLFSPHEGDMDTTEAGSVQQHNIAFGADNLPNAKRQAQLMQAHLHDAVMRNSEQLLIPCSVGDCSHTRNCLFQPCGHITHCIDCSQSVEVCRAHCHETGRFCDRPINNRIIYSI